MLYPQKKIKMKKISIAFLTGILLYGCGSTKALVTADKAPIIVAIDLVNIQEDKVRVGG